MKNKFKRTFGGSTSFVSGRAWMGQVSTAGRLNGPKPPERERMKTLTIEQWDGEKWINRLLVWDGSSYVDSKEVA